MFRLVSIILLFLSNVFAGSYQVKLGSFRNYDGLMGSISKLKDESYKSKISIEQEGEMYYVYSRVYENYAEVQDALSAYREVFKDAFIKEDASSSMSSVPKESTLEVKKSTEVLHKTPWRSVATSVPVSPRVEKKMPDKQMKLSFSEQLKRKTFYLCYEGKRKGAVKPVIKAVFNQRFIRYSSEMMEIPPIITQYKLKNNDLHISVGMFSVAQTRSRLESVTDKYLRTDNWADGKRVQSLRFYFNKSDAMAFARRN